MSSVNVEQWEAEVFADHRVNPIARRIAKTLADHFREGGGSCQLSADKLADAAGIIDASTARNGLHRLKRYGWIIAEQVPNTGKRGLQYRPTMPVSAAAQVQAEVAEQAGRYQSTGLRSRTASVRRSVG